MKVLIGTVAMIAGLLVLCLLLAGGGVGFPSTTNFASSSEAPHSQTGCATSRRAIEAKLKSPGSAKWVDCNSTTSAGVQTVTLSVDSQNSLGALIRSQWVTTVRDNRVESVTQIR